MCLVELIATYDSRSIKSAPTHTGTIKKLEVAASTKSSINQLLIPGVFLERGINSLPELEGSLVALNENQSDVDVAVDRIVSKNKIKGPGQGAHICFELADSCFTDQECTVGEQDRVPKICRNAVDQEFDFDGAAPEMMPLSLIEPQLVWFDNDRLQRKVVTQRILQVLVPELVVRRVKVEPLFHVTSLSGNIYEPNID